MAQTLDLNGDWRLTWADSGRGHVGMSFAEAIAARVPGDVHLDLLRARLIEEPLIARNAEACRWVEEKDWWYSREFTLPTDFKQDRVELDFAGLDTTAEIWLNDVKVGEHNNMFVPYVIDVTEAVREGTNRLTVRLDPGVRAVQAKEDRRKYPHISSLRPTGLPRMWMRKAQYTCGWDWAPRLLTCGIWRPVTLRAYRAAALRDVWLIPRLAGGKAIAQVRVEVECFAREEKRLRLSMRLEGNTTCSQELEIVARPGANLVESELEIEKPILWWPRPLGEPFLYDFTLEVSDAEGLLDRHATQCGLREIALLQEPLLGNEGTSFAFFVNGEKVFCQGTNWSPVDSIPARVSREKYQSLVEAAAQANMNMIRVWGGGYYEDPYFYHLCDQVGILVWQDFMFACSLVPDDNPDFCAEVKREAEIVVRTLRNHPCLALWCGNNENDWIYSRRVKTGHDVAVFYGRRIYHEILPEVCARLDPTRPYWPSSPFGGDDPNSELAGDRHHWDVPINLSDSDARVDFGRWLADRGKFISEYGMMSPPPAHSLQKFLPADELSLGSPSWEYHNNQFERGLLNTALRCYWREPNHLPLEEYVLAAQLIQAEALQRSLEAFRRRKFNCSGALFWNYADCWGAVSCAVIDYYQNKKPAYYAVRRALAPLMVSVREADDGLEMWLVNDERREWRGELEFGPLDFNTAAWQPETMRAEVGPNAAARVTTVPRPDLPEADVAFSVRFHANDGEVATNRHFLAGFCFKDLKLAMPGLSWQLAQMGDDRFSLTIRADRFAWGVHVPDRAEVWLSDNYFDLWPGEARQITLHGPESVIRAGRPTSLNEILFAHKPERQR